MKYIIIGIVAFIVLGIILHFINKSYYMKYGYNLYGGGIAMLLVIACAAGAFLLSKTSVSIAMILGGAGVVILIILIVVNTKRFGFGAGIGALILQIIFSVPSLLLIIELISGKGYSSTYNSISREQRKMEQERQRRNNDRNYY